MLEAGRQAECPNCGAPIAWKLGSSQAAVCGFCRFSVVRSDRALSARGRVADLVPTAAPLAVGDEGTAEGKSFVVLGRMQLDHGRGPWDEWYVGFADGSWGWLARAEGRWYLTFAEACSDAPAWDSLTPGTATSLSGTRYVATERGGSAVLSAEGELPFPVDPHGSGRYVDLEGDAGAFATLDFGDGSAPPQLFAGHELPARELVWQQTAVGPRPSERVQVERLRCPHCGAPIDIFVPSETERCACAACGALLDYEQGALSLLKQLDPPRIRPLIELGSKGALLGDERLVIGFMQRYVEVDGERFTFREYLLHSEHGYSWLLEENGHWLHVSPVSTGAVVERSSGARYKGVIYRAFAKAEPSVDFVIGEFYWKVEQGDRAQTIDYIAPPRLLSVERTDNEVSWSEGEYVEPHIVERAFALKQKLPRPQGVAPAQPNPHGDRGASRVLALLATLWFLLAFAYELGNHKDVLVDMHLSLPERTQYGLPTSAVQGGTVFSPTFEVRGGPTTLKLELASPISNGWVQLATALIPEGGGEPREQTVVVEHYQGSNDGENWDSGGADTEAYFGRVQSGKYTLRMQTSWEPNDNGWAAQLTPPGAHVTLTKGKRSPFCCLGALFLIVLPFLLARGRRIAFEVRRRENESL